MHRLGQYFNFMTADIMTYHTPLIPVRREKQNSRFLHFSPPGHRYLVRIPVRRENRHYFAGQLAHCSLQQTLLPMSMRDRDMLM